MDYDITGGNLSFYDLVETGYNLITGAGEDIVEFVTEDAPGFISSAYEKVEDIYESLEGSKVLDVGKNIAGSYLASSSRESATRSFRDPGYRKQAGARDVSSQRDVRSGGIDPQSVGYTSRVTGMMAGLDKSLVPTIAELYQRLESGRSQGPNIPIPGDAQDIDIELAEKYVVG